MHIVVKVLTGILLVLGILCLVAGFVFYFDGNNMINAKIDSSVPLVNGSEAFSDWNNSAVPVYMQFWVFHTVNSQEVLKNGDKPKVVELGPYTYREIRPKENVSFLANETKLRYVGPKGYVFVPEMSNGTENDTFIGINVPILTVANEIRFWSSIYQDGLKLLLESLGEELFEEFTVWGYLWGYEIKSIQTINNFTQKHFHIKLLPDAKFGLFYGAGTGNMSNDGNYTIYTGKEHLDLLNIIDNWNNQSSLPYWTTPYCNDINGTDGSMWHPHINQSETLYVFSSDICRSIYLKFENITSVHGIDVYRFVPPRDVFAAVEDNPDNIGFCTPDCLGAGVLNVSNCKGAPIIVSQPHFFQGDQNYTDAIDGLHPSLDHQTHINVEPYTGHSLVLAKKLQLNVYIRQLKGLSGSENLKDIIYPLIWLNESATIDASTAEKFRSQVIRPIAIVNHLHSIFFGIGAPLVLFFIIIVIQMVILKKKQERDEPLLTEAADD